MPKLALTVHVHDPETGQTVVLNRGTKVSGRHRTLITNPDVWEDSESVNEFEVPSGTEGKPTESSADEPPRAGAGSGRDAWVAFAASRGVHVENEDKRDDIIAALVDAGVIDE